MLPSYLPLNIANKILFTGEAVHIFDKEKNKLNSHFDGKYPNWYTEQMSFRGKLLFFCSDFFLLLEYSGLFMSSVTVNKHNCYIDNPCSYKIPSTCQTRLTTVPSY